MAAIVTPAYRGPIMNTELTQLCATLDRLTLPREVMQFAWEHYPERTALIGPDEEWTYAQLHRRVQMLAQALARMGLRKGNRCYMQLANGCDQLQASMAAMQTGVILIGIPRNAGSNVLGFFCQNVPPAGLLYEAGGEADVALLRRLAPGIALYRHDPLAPCPEAPIADAAAVPLSPDDISMIGFSSGTTGAPKVLQASYGTYLTGMRLIVKHVLPAQRAAGPMTMLVCIPVAGAGSGVVLPTWFTGGTLIIPAACTADECLRLIPLHRVTNIFITPSLLIDLLDHPLLDCTDLSSLRSILYGTELMPAAKLEEALQRFGPILQQGYGSAEVLPPVTLLQPQDHMRDGRPAPRSVLGSVGKAVPEVQIIIASDDDDLALPANTIGNVLIKSPTQFQGYLNRPEANGKVLRAGWLRMGDIGFLDDDGLLHVLGRGPDLIRRHGRITYPRYAEEALHDHPAIKETVCVQVGEQALMVASLRQDWRWCLEDATLTQALMDFLGARLPAQDMPDGVRLLRELPRSPLGKVLRREVRELFAAEQCATKPTAPAPPRNLQEVQP